MLYTYRCHSSSIMPEFHMEARDTVKAVDKLKHLFGLVAVSVTEGPDHTTVRLGNDHVWFIFPAVAYVEVK